MLEIEIEKQSELIRSLKAKNASKEDIELQIMELIKLKAYQEGYFIAPIVRTGLLIINDNHIVNVNDQTSFQVGSTRFLICEENKNNIKIIVRTAICQIHTLQFQNQLSNLNFAKNEINKLMNDNNFKEAILKLKKLKKVQLDIELLQRINKRTCCSNFSPITLLPNIKFEMDGIF